MKHDFIQDIGNNFGIIALLILVVPVLFTGIFAPGASESSTKSSNQSQERSQKKVKKDYSCKECSFQFNHPITVKKEYDEFKPWDWDKENDFTPEYSSGCPSCGSSDLYGP